jgi:hypothetical protein
MRDKPPFGPFGPLDIQTILRKLTDTPLLAALFLLSPAEALTYMGFGVLARFLDSLRPTTAEDVRQVKLLVQALDQGYTTLEQPQVVQAATPPAPPPAGARPPDVVLNVSKATLQHVLKHYTRHNFKGQEFSIPAQRWGNVRAIGEDLALDLSPGQARIVATFQGTIQLLMPMPLGRNLELGAVESPVELDVLTTFSVGADDLLSMDISHGEIRLSRVPLPEVVARELVRRLIAAVPTIPIIKVPTHFDLPDAASNAAGALELDALGVQIEADAVRLEFQLAPDTATGVYR